VSNLNIRPKSCSKGKTEMNKILSSSSVFLKAYVP